MPFTPIKSEHVRSVTTLQGTSIPGFMNAVGVEYPREGQNDPLIPFSVNYDTQIVNANVLFPVPGATYGVVWAFPVNAVPVKNVGHVKGPIIPQYRRPRYAR